MTITADRNTPFRDGVDFVYPMAANTTLYAGQAVVLNSAGNAEAASLATGKISAGICLEKVTSTTIALTSVKVRRGVACFDNHGTITKASIGDNVYFYDDVAVQASGTSASVAGKMVDIDSLGVWVDLNPDVSTGLVAANNLSDVGTVATACTSLGLGTGDSPTFTGITATGDVTLQGGAGALTMTTAASSVVCLNNSATGLLMGSSGMVDLLVFDTRTGVEKIKVKGTTTQVALHVDVGTFLVDEAATVTGIIYADGGIRTTAAAALAIGAATTTVVNIGATANPVAITCVSGAIAAPATITAAGAISGLGLTSVKTNDYTVTTGGATDGGAVIQCATDAKYVILPAIAAGNKGLKVTCQNTGADDGVLTGFKINANNYVKGTVVGVSAAATKGKGFLSTKVGANQGDYLTVMSDGTDTWWIIGGVGIWAEQA